eukprot:s2303_g3.t1
MIDPSTGIRTEAPPSSDWTDRPDIPEYEDALGTTKDMSDDECILVLRGSSSSCDDMVVPSYQTGVSNRDVFRLGLSEVRIAVFHMSSFGWRSAWNEGCENWLQFLTAAIAAQVEAEDNLSTGKEMMMKKKRLKLKKQKMKMSRLDGFVPQRHPQVLAIAAKRQLADTKTQIADYRDDL